MTSKYEDLFRANRLFGGFLTGTVLSVLVLGVISVLTQPQFDDPPQADAVEVPAGSEFKQSREDTEAALPEADDAPGAGSVPQVAPPEPDDLSSLQDADTVPSQQPETGSAEGTLETPQTPSTEVGLEVETDEPVLPSPQTLAPEAPEDEQDLSVSTEPRNRFETEAEVTPSISVEPAQPIQPEVEEDSGVFQSEETEQSSEAEQVSEPEPAESEEVSNAESAESEQASEPETTVTEQTSEPEPGRDRASERHCVSRDRRSVAARRNCNGRRSGRGRTFWHDRQSCRRCDDRPVTFGE